MSFPIAVASKARPEAPLFAQLIVWESERQWLVYVEPQDYGRYLAKLPAIRVCRLPEDDCGLPYVRQFILEKMRAVQPQGWFWLLDDDITGWRRADYAGKNVRIDLDQALTEAEQRTVALPEDVAQVGFEYQQFSWSAKAPGFAWNSYADVAVGIHAGRSRLANFRPSTDLKCDRDFTLQLLANGQRVARFRDLAFAAPKNGSNAGGLAPAYAESGREAASSAEMCRLWGSEVCTFHRKPDGRPDVKIKWKALGAAPKPRD